MNKKKLLSLALVVIMIATISFSSLAWFTDKDDVKNDFTIGGAGQEDADKIFSMEVWEKGEDGTPVEGMKFDNILPGDHHTKEAYITNTGAYEQYIRVTMTITDWNLIKNLVTIKMDEKFAENWHIDTKAVELDADGNLKTKGHVVLNDDGELVVVMYLTKKLPAGETVDIMDYVEISTAATQHDFIDPAFADGFQIHIEADAAQTENIVTNPSADEWQNAKKTFGILEG